MISPILHLIYAGLIAGGAKPSGIGSNELNVRTKTRRSILSSDGLTKVYS
jgi:hypothetical protein